MSDTVTKTCSTCGQAKPLTEFGVRKNNQGRVYPFKDCRTCMAAARHANVDRYEQELAKQRAARAAKNAELAISTEISELIRATTSRRTTTPARVTEEELRVWYRKGCPIREKVPVTAGR